MVTIEQLQLQHERELEDYRLRYERAIHQEYSILNLAGTRYYVIKRISTTSIYHDCQDVASYKVVSRKLDYDQVVKALKQFRTTGKSEYQLNS